MKEKQWSGLKPLVTQVVEVSPKTIGGPLDLLALREEFNQRLRSSGGRPTDPAWTVTRLVPFKEDNWTRLPGPC